MLFGFINQRLMF